MGKVKVQGQKMSPMYILPLEVQGPKAYSMEMMLVCYYTTVFQNKEGHFSLRSTR